MLIIFLNMRVPKQVKGNGACLVSDRFVSNGSIVLLRLSVRVCACVRVNGSFDLAAY